jgi:hypothetical protein
LLAAGDQTAVLSDSQLNRSVQPASSTLT